jgi:hypothetical protein
VSGMAREDLDPYSYIDDLEFQWFSLEINPKAVVGVPLDQTSSLTPDEYQACPSLSYMQPTFFNPCSV